MLKENTQGRSSFNRAAELVDMTGYAEDLALKSGFNTIIVANRPTLVQCPDADRPVEIMPGGLLFIPAGTHQRVTLPDTFDVLVASCQATRDDDAASLMTPSSMTMVVSPKQISAITQVARRVCASARADNRDCVMAIANLLLSEVAHAVSEEANTVAPAKGAMDAHSLKTIDEFIDDNLEEALSLEKLSALMGMSNYQFSRQFKCSTGTSPFQYVINKRVQRAREMLEHGATSIAEIAYATGFSSQSHLTETFKRHLGVPPGAYKREYATAA